MRHFAGLDESVQDAVFAHRPAPFDRRSDRRILAYALGALLYTPGVRAGIAERLLAGRYPDLTGIVLCLEDAIADDDLPRAQRSVLRELDVLVAAVEADPEARSRLPLVFVRVRSPEHAEQLGGALGARSSVLAGVCLAKFSSATASSYLEVVEAIPAGGERLWALPILESPDVVHVESRIEALEAIAAVLDRHRETVLGLRIGGTDISGLFGLRRSPEQTIYDLAVVRDCLADIVNVLGRTGRGHVISGPVWEYFSTAETRLLKPQLRQTPFDLAGADGELRLKLISGALDGLIREVLLDKANGLVGKTIIHPSHIAPVHALQVVTFAEHADACAVRDSRGGAGRSIAGGSMNESKPHGRWAAGVLARAAAFGVLHEQQTFVSVLDELEHASSGTPSG